MRQQEAEEEAAQRNASDERRERLVFYAFDESAGLAEDAWEVATRLRLPDEFQWEMPTQAPPPPAAEVAVEDELGYEPEPAIAEPAAAPVADHEPESRRPRAGRRGRMLRAWGYFVILVGVVFVAATITVWVGFRSYLQIGPLVIVALVVAGVFAIWVGAQIARPPR